LLGQKPELDFLPDFRNVFAAQARAENPSLTNNEILDSYARKLRDEGVQEAEIARRIRLIREERPLLDADYFKPLVYCGGVEIQSCP
jgi:hypothetical protein